MTKTNFLLVPFFVFVLFIGFGRKLNAQIPYRLTLDEVVSLAQSDAPDALLAATRWKRNYWTYRSFQADFKPQILLSANNLPFYNRSIESITLPDGRQQYVARSFMNNGLDISLQQDFAPTGGTVFFGSALSRLDLFATDLAPKETSYLSTPLRLGIVQPLFQFNTMKWRKKIEPVVYQESEKQYSEQMEAVANRAMTLFFELLVSQLDAEAARQDKANADTLLVLSQGRYEVGKIAETDLLQVQLSAMQSDSRLADAELKMETNTEQLRDFLDLQGDVQFDLIPPYDLPDMHINKDDALNYAMQNRSDVVAYQRRILEAQQEVARAKGETGVTASLTGNFGLTQTGLQVSDAYRSPIDQEVVTFGISAPIADWGKSKAKRSVAMANLELEQRQVEQEKENFRRVVVLRAQQFDLVRNNAEIAERYLEAARKRYDITYQRYLIGKISITDLNLALADQESARRGYLQAVRDFWTAVFELRGLTLYDFIRQQSLMKTAPIGG
ncbi:MAG TPA: TolC family protein [Saprospiraceae bacterium]|nr:TolC family protein [Saprospiraceae bacterium]